MENIIDRKILMLENMKQKHEKIVEESVCAAQH
jgi:hypothetical protein